MTQERLSAHFVDSVGGRIFLLLRQPSEPERSDRCVLFVPPFGEEMNKSRRQMTAVAKSLVAHGLSVLSVDLFGTGDSEGEFAGATWETWKANVATAMQWVERQGIRPDALVATRLGCVLAAQVLRDVRVPLVRSVFWQPVESGQQFMTQFLRLRVAASMMEADRHERVDDLKERLRGGQTLEVAGYALSPALWHDIEGLSLAESLHSGVGRLKIVEVGRLHGEELSPVVTRVLRAAEQRGIDAAAGRVPGEPFWSATEIVVNSALTAATTRHLTGAV